MAKPGVMFYFDLRPCMKRLTLEEKGRLFEAIMDYSELGAVPELEGVLGVAWDFIQPRIDRDDETYEKKAAQKQYAVFTREQKKKGLEVISFGEWKALSDIERDQLISSDTPRYPTTTPTSSSSSTTTTASSSTTASASTIRESIAGKPATRTRFVAPKVDEVRAFCQEKGYLSVDPERFVNFYQSKGWMVGRSPMKDWKAAVRGWSGGEKKENRKSLLGYGEDEVWTL